MQNQILYYLSEGLAGPGGALTGQRGDIIVNLDNVVAKKY